MTMQNNAGAIDAPLFSKHHKSHSVLCDRLVTVTSGSWLATCSTSCLTCGWQKEGWTSWLMTYHMQQYLRLMSGYMQLNDDLYARAINAASFSKHHKSDSVLCYRIVPLTSGSWLATCSTSCLACGWQKERWTSWLMTYHMHQYLRLMSLAQWWLKCKGTFIV